MKQAKLRFPPPMLPLDLESRILKLALDRGLLEAYQVDLEGSPVPEDSGPVRWGPRLHRLLLRGLLSRDLLDALAWEAIQLHSPSPVLPGPTCPSSWVDATLEPLGEDFAPESQPWERYRELTYLGGGGTARVYKAFDPVLQRWVALKFLKGEQSLQRDLLLREARAQARVDHPHVCKIYEVGEFQGHPYICMQLVGGLTLAQAAPRLTLRQKVAILRDVAEGVHASHRNGLLHLDLKPGNILVETFGGGEEPHPYVTDFGLVRETGRDEALREGSLGTPPYSSPEQVAGGGRRLGPRSDVYSLGVVLYVLLTDTYPFQAASFEALLRMIQQAEPVPLRQRNPDLPAELESIVHTCLHKGPEHRYPSARSLAEDLQRHLDGLSPLIWTPRRRGRLMRPLRRQPAVAALLFLALLALTWLLVRPRHRTPIPPAAAPEPFPGLAASAPPPPLPTGEEVPAPSPAASTPAERPPAPNPERPAAPERPASPERRPAEAPDKGEAEGPSLSPEALLDQAEKAHAEGGNPWPGLRDARQAAYEAIKAHPGEAQPYLELARVLKARIDLLESQGQVPSDNRRELVWALRQAAARAPGRADIQALLQKAEARGR